jgi:hypothetical protein
MARATLLVSLFSLLALLLLWLPACEVNRPAVGQVDIGAALSDSGWITDIPLQPDAGAHGCALLTTYNTAKKVADFQTAAALISPDLKWAWLITHRGNADGDLYEVNLLSGKLAKRAGVINAVSQLGSRGAVLATRITNKTKRIFDLLQLDPGGFRADTVASDVCAFQSAGGGKKVALLRACDNSLGRLDLLDLPSGTITKVEDGVGFNDFKLDPDARMLAYSVAEKGAKDCLAGTGRLKVRYLQSGKTYSFGSATRSGSLGLMPNGLAFLYRRVVSCKPSEEQLRVVSYGTAGSGELAKLPPFGFSGHIDRRTGQYGYAVSPDSKWVLAAELDMTAGKKNLLHQINSRTGAKTVVADKLFPFHMVSLAFTAYSFSGDGKHVVYITDGSAYPSMALAAVPSLGSKSRNLSQLVPASFLPSNKGGKVAYVEGGYSGPNTLYVTDLNDKDKRTKVYSSAYALADLGWVADDRGVLWTERVKDGTVTLRLRHALGAWPPPLKYTILGSWKTRYMQSRPPYVMDTAGCLVLFNQYNASHSGTYLRRLP